MKARLAHNTPPAVAAQLESAQAPCTGVAVAMAGEEDWWAIESLMQENFSSDGYMRHTVEDHELHQAEIDKARQIISHNGRDAVLLVAYASGQPGGYLMCERITSQRQQHVCDFHMYVCADLRRMGIGRALLNELLSWCLWHPLIRKIELCVMADNMGARGLYERTGFRIEGIRKGTAIKDGKLSDLVLMGLFLEEKPANGFHPTPAIMSVEQQKQQIGAAL